MKTFFSFLLMILMIKSNSTFNHPKGVICKFCEDMQNSVFNLYKDHKDKIYSLANSLCKSKANSYLCDYFVYRDGKNLLDNEINFIETTKYICSHTFDLCDKTYKKYDFKKFRNSLYQNFQSPIKEKIIKEKKISIKNKILQKEIFKNIKKKEIIFKEKLIPKINLKKYKNFTALTINDVHLQRDYLYKGKVNCNDPAGCCYEKMSESEEGQRAGYWGTPTSKCDTPKYFWEETLKNLKKKEFNTDFIFLLGDNYGHTYFRDKNHDEIYKWNNYFYDSVKKNFPDSNIIPVLGNHETDPVNYFDFEDKNNSVIKNILPNFKKFISDDKVEDFINNGFYDLEFEEFGVKFISLNSQMADVENFYLLKKHTDLLNFFEKLAKSISISEKKGQKVIFLNHINIGNSGTYNGYDRNMYSLIERFKNTITTSFSAHTHKDEYRFIKNRDKKIIHVNFISPSITTDGNYNPSFRIYKFIDSKLNDYDQYRFDIDFYNKKAENSIFDFNFKKAYSFKEEYGLKKWESFEDYEYFSKLLSEDKDTQKTYIKNKWSRFVSVDWEKESYSIKCQILGNIREQKKCYEALNGGSSILDFFNTDNLFRYFFIKPWLVPIK